MHLKTFLRKAQETTTINVWFFVSNVALIVAVTSLAMRITTFEERIVMVPMSVPTKMTVGWDGASDDYYQSVGMTTAMLIGNITPSNVEFVKTTLGKYLDSAIYPSVKAQLDKLAKDPLFNATNTTNHFSPSKTVFEPETGKVFVVGTLVVTGAVQYATTKVVTYEFGIRIVNGTPLIVSLDSYETDQPRTLIYKAQNPNWNKKPE